MLRFFDFLVLQSNSHDSNKLGNRVPPRTVLEQLYRNNPIRGKHFCNFTKQRKQLVTPQIHDAEALANPLNCRVAQHDRPILFCNQEIQRHTGIERLGHSIQNALHIHHERNSLWALPFVILPLFELVRF